MMLIKVCSACTCLLLQQSLPEICPTQTSAQETQIDELLWRNTQNDKIWELNPTSDNLQVYNRILYGNNNKLSLGIISGFNECCIGGLSQARQGKMLVSIYIEEKKINDNRALRSPLRGHGKRGTKKVSLGPVYLPEWGL